MPSSQSEHPSTARPVGEYQPGGRMVQPVGSRGTRAVQENAIPKPPRQRLAVVERQARDTERQQNPPRRGRPVGSKNRQPIPQEMLDAAPDEE